MQAHREKWIAIWQAVGLHGLLFALLFVGILFQRSQPPLSVAGGSIEAVLSDPSLAGWDGFGVVVQAYGRRAGAVLDWLHGLATRLDRKLILSPPVRPAGGGSGRSVPPAWPSGARPSPTRP